uniref:Leukotriene A4 hydrolase n=1 Tax=Pipistrellus kuhlii TaxID=59472 RepID=A0A7J7ZKL1_PIPKU|nr:leukotriene A4 hydrolase [Pipistrellus kuhlii]
MPEVMDTCSLATPASVCRTKHLHLRCSVDFARRALTGTAALTVQAQEDNLRSLVLDTKDLTIEKVVINGQEVKYVLGERQSYKGSPMEISLPIALSKNQEVVIEISFETSPKSSALQWLTPEQTSGKEHPYLFSQCQAIHCRAILPCQDTPSVKLTYSAEVNTTSYSLNRVIHLSKCNINDMQREALNFCLIKFCLKYVQKRLWISF